MKKTISFILALILLLGLTACAGGNKTEEKTGLQAGWGRENITPTYAVPIGGYTDRISVDYRDYQYMTCIAVTDGNETVLIYTMDLAHANVDSFAEELRASITEATGVLADRIFMGATHTHSGGAVYYTTPASKQYKQEVLDAAAKAGQSALADMAPCQFLIAHENIKGMNFVRHYKVADGTYYGSNFGDATPGIVDHAYEPDDQLTLLKFDRNSEKKDILFVGWQAHPDHAYANGWSTLSADFPGAMRSELEYNNDDLLVAYYGGASGDLNTFSEIEELNHGLGMTQYGEKLAELVAGIMEKLKPVEGTAIKATSKFHALAIDHSWDHMIAEAREISTLFNQKGRDYASKEGYKYGFSSSIQANAIVRRVSLGQYEERRIGAFCIGDVGFVEAPFEMFSTSAKFIKENSPFGATVVIAGNYMYLPTQEAYDYHSYEADTSNFARGEAEKVNNEFVSMLKSLK